MNLRHHHDETQGIVTLVVNLDFVSCFKYSDACFYFSVAIDHWSVSRQGHTLGFSGCFSGCLLG
jgi:hypothetical protein